MTNMGNQEPSGNNIEQILRIVFFSCLFGAIVIFWGIYIFWNNIENMNFGTPGTEAFSNFLVFFMPLVLLGFFLLLDGL